MCAALVCLKAEESRLVKKCLSQADLECYKIFTEMLHKCTGIAYDGLIHFKLFWLTHSVNLTRLWDLLTHGEGYVYAF